jgi:hypothetical protein
MNKDVVRQVVVIVAVLLTIAVNGLAGSTELIGGQNTAAVSNNIPALFTPAGYVFSIWGVIYLGLIAYAIFQALPAQRENPRLRRIGYLFVLSCAANMAWLLLWQYEILPVTIVLMLALLGSLIAISLRLGTGRTAAPLAERLTVRLPFSVYLGWISVATIANAAAVLYRAGWASGGLGLSGQAWTVVMLGAAVVIAALMSYFRGDVAYLAVLVWAFVGIARNSLPQFAGATLVTTASWVAAGLVAVLAVAGYALRARRSPQKA